MRRPKKYDSESNLHLQVVQYLRLQYPDVIFRTDYSAGLHLPPAQAVAHARLQSGRAYPDLFIVRPKLPHYHGLFLELKKEGTKLVKKNGEMVANIHYREQQAVCDKLYELGYFARIVVGFDEAKRYIDWYLRDQADFLAEHADAEPHIWNRATKREEF